MHESTRIDNGSNGNKDKIINPYIRLQDNKFIGELIANGYKI